MGMLEYVPIPTDRHRRLVIQIQRAEDSAEGDGGLAKRGKISCIQLFLRFLYGC